VPVAAPATIVVGSVADLRLASYEDRPLAGRTVVVTRAPDQAGALVDALEAAGAAVVRFPTRATAPPEDGGAALRRAVARRGGLGWVVVASPSAVGALFTALRDARDLAGARIAAVGPGTAAALAGHGVVADLVGEAEPGEGAAAALLARFPRPEADAGRVLLPQAAGGRAELGAGLAELGWEVEMVEAYRSVVPPADPVVLEQLAVVDAAVFASPSALDGFLEVAGTDRLPPVVVTIGPTTSAAARRRTVVVSAEAAAPDAEAIVAAVRAALAPGRP
jgi:uroporphyrinogen III methyltransferase/synthase